MLLRCSYYWGCFPHPVLRVICSNDTRSIKEMYPLDAATQVQTYTSLSPSLTTMGVANCKNIKCLYFCRNTPLDLHQSPSFSKENKWNKAGRRYLLLLEVDRWQHLSVDNSSRQLFWGLWYLLSARKFTWLWCNWWELGNMDRGNWTLWNQFCKGSGDLLTGAVFWNSYIQLAANTGVFLVRVVICSQLYPSWLILQNTAINTNRSTHWLHLIKYSKLGFHLQITILGTHRDISERKYQPNLTSVKPSKWTNLYFRLCKLKYWRKKCCHFIWHALYCIDF